MVSATMATSHMTRREFTSTTGSRNFCDAKSIRLWKANQEASDKSKKRRKTNFFTDETAASAFDLQKNGLGLGAIDVTGAV